MRRIVQTLDAGSRAGSFMLGGFVMVLAAVTMTTSMTAFSITTRAQQVFGITFIGLMAVLIFTSLFCWAKVSQQTSDKFWLTAGIQAANGVTTLALTYTLLGISLGIGTLAEQQLTPETVRFVIRELTDKLSLAFMTTVIGLPTAAVLRTLLLVTHAHHKGRNIDIGKE